MQNSPVRFSIVAFLRFVALLTVLTLFTASCQFPSFGKKPPCGQSILQIGDVTYQIKETKTKSDGSLKISSNTPDIAYWVNQTDTNQVFALSPTTENLALQNTTPDKAVVTWANCNSSTYTLSAPQTGLPDMNTLLDQSVSGITILVQNGNTGFVIHGEFMGEEIQAFDTPDPSSIQAEISLLETTTSTDGKTIRVQVSILNNGQAPITLSASDVSLTPENATAVALETSEPALPKEIKVGATETLYLTFPRPTTPSATVKIFSAEYELDGY
jgi:hypothetical protein